MRHFLSNLFPAATLLVGFTGPAAAGVEGGIIGGKGKGLACSESDRDCIENSRTYFVSEEIYQLTVEGLKKHDMVYIVIREGEDGIKILSLKEENGRILNANDGIEILPNAGGRG